MVLLSAYSVSKKGPQDMSDMPIQTVLQQRDARPVPGEHLEVLGKKAASDWGFGKFASLTEAVVDTVRGERLGPEQVLRVVEFCNSSAYLTEFRKEGSHKVVNFEGGPADPAQVIQDLNDGGGGTVYDRGMLDYNMSPSLATKEAAWRNPEIADFDKTASVDNDPPGANLPKLKPLPSLPKMASPLDRHDAELWAMFGNNEGGKIASADPLQPLKEVHDKLAGALGQAQSELDGLEVDYQLAGRDLYDQVKQAAMDGVTLGQMVAAWSSVQPDPLYVKVAFSVLTPRLRAEHVFDSLDAVGESLAKTASVGRLNAEHPLLYTYAEYCTTLNKVANMRVLVDEFSRGAAESLALLKQAAGGLVGVAKGGLHAVSRGIDRAAPAVAHAMVGSEGAKKLAPRLAKGLKGTALVGGALGANAAVQGITDRPAVHGTIVAAKSLVPGTMEYQNRRYRNMTGQ